jgi:hypothetical protein
MLRQGVALATLDFSIFLIYIPRQQKKEKKKKAVTSCFEYEVDH